jgi:hypothetical protein
MPKCSIKSGMKIQHEKYAEFNHLEAVGAFTVAESVEVRTKELIYKRPTARNILRTNIITTLNTSICIV